MKVKSQTGFTPLEIYAALKRRVRNTPHTLFIPLRSPNSASLTGFTMLETIVAIAILLAAILGPVTLITRGLFGSTFSKNKIVALHLAEEGIEFVRTIRENNKLCEAVGAPGWDWRRSSNGLGLMMGPGQTVDATNLDNVTCGPVGTELTFSNPHLSSPCSQAAGPKLLRETAGINKGRYGYISGTPSIFTRCLTITQPVNECVQPSCLLAIPILGVNILDVTSTVYWQEHNISRSVILRERIYNWDTD